MTALGHERRIGAVRNISAFTPTSRRKRTSLNRRWVPEAVIAAIRRTVFMECWRDDDGLFRLDVGSPDHLGPLVGLIGDEFCEPCGCEWHRLNA